MNLWHRFLAALEAAEVPECPAPPWTPEALAELRRVSGPRAVRVGTTKGGDMDEIDKQHPCVDGTCGHTRAKQPGHAERVLTLQRQWDEAGEVRVVASADDEELAPPPERG